MKRYMRDQVEFLGIKAGPRRALFADFVRRNGLPKREELHRTADTLWNLPYREYQYTAVDILIRVTKQLDPDAWPLCEQLITSKSWWDTVDGLAASVVGTLYKRYPKDGRKWIGSWRRSAHLWLRRTAILFQLKYGTDTDWTLLRQISNENARSDEFFIQKAIGWALRQYAQVDADAVLEFVESSDLSALSRREALKRISARKMSNSR